MEIRSAAPGGPGLEAWSEPQGNVAGLQGKNDLGVQKKIVTKSQTMHNWNWMNTLLKVTNFDYSEYLTVNNKHFII